MKKGKILLLAVVLSISLVALTACGGEDEPVAGGNNDNGVVDQQPNEPNAPNEPVTPDNGTNPDDSAISGTEGDKNDGNAPVTPDTKPEDKPSSTPDKKPAPDKKPEVKPTPTPKPDPKPEEKPSTPEDNTGDKEESDKTESFTIKDILTEISEAEHIPGATEVSTEMFKASYGLDEAWYEEAYGMAPMINVKVNEVFGVKAVDAHKDSVKEALQKHKDAVCKTFEQYLQDQYEIAKAAEIYQKGNYYFLIMAEDNAAVKKVIDTYFK